MYYCSKCEQRFSKFRHLQTHWAHNECISPDERENQQLRRPIDQLKNVWLNDNPFCDLNSHSESESDSDNDVAVIVSDTDDVCEGATNIPPHHSSNSELQTELLHHIVVILEKLADRMSPQQHKSPSDPTPRQAPSHHHCHTTVPPLPEWQTVKKRTTPKRDVAQSFEHANNFNVLTNFDRELNPPQSEVQHHLKSEICKPNSPPKQKIRPQVVINQKPESVTTWPKTIPGHMSYADTVKRGRNVMLYSDSICNRMSKWELNKKATDAGINCQINKKAFVGATSEDLYTHHMMPTLKINTPDAVIIHAGINDAKQLAGKDGGMSSEVMDTLALNVIECGQVAKSHGVNSVCISALLPIRGRKYQQTINHINYRIEHLCKKQGFDFITNKNIVFTEATPVDEGLHYKDGLHLNGAGRQILMDNFISYLNTH